MQLFDNGGQVADRPAPLATVAPGWAQNGGPPNAPTIADPDWANAVSAELLTVLTAASIVPSKTAVNQVLTALQTLFAPLGAFGYFDYLSTPGSGNWVAPFTGTILALVWGAGAGTTGTSNGVAAANGAGAGGFGLHLMSVTEGDSYAYDIGAPGTGSAYGTAGTNGGATTWNGTVTANGGNGSTGTSTGTGGHTSGANLLNLTGGAGFPSQLPAGGGNGGNGGASPWGGSSASGSVSQGGSGPAPGGGAAGGGSEGTYTGNAGANGGILILRVA